MSDTTTAVRHVMARLAAAPALSGVPVWEGVAVEGAAYPLVLVQVYGDGRDVSGTGGFRAATAVTVLVRAVVEGGDLGAVEPLADAIDAALHGTGPHTYGAGAVASCVRTAEHAMTETAGGRTWRYGGGYFDVITYRPGPV